MWFRLPLFMLLFGQFGLTSIATSGSLQGSEWQPTLLNDTPLPEATDSFIQFRSKGRLAGFSGCNRLMAEYFTDGQAILIGPVAATRMRCDDLAMTMEADLSGALERARTYRREQTRLVLFDARGNPILELRQTDWD